MSTDKPGNPPSPQPHSPGLGASPPISGRSAERHPAIDRIDDALRDLRYGSVLAIVQDGVVVQIERTEKTRLTRPG
ncbi:MAG: DUF2292 domain-containing protein [Planctomycetota bacterium]|nr:MAG: DUF2292 domain-containing protein [Planctomycetota bacterium]